MEIRHSNYRSVRNKNTERYGFAEYIKKVYMYVGGGLFLSGIAAYLTSQSLDMMIKFTTKQMWVILLVPCFLLLWLYINIERMSNTTARIFYALFTITNGISLAPIFHIYTSESITSCFFVTSAIFLCMALYGHFTKRDLSTLGSLCIMGLLGIIVASILNLFIMSSTIMFLSTIISVFVFVGLIAYDSQKLNLLYNIGDNQKTAIIGALALYLDFINLFRALLSLFGKRK